MSLLMQALRKAERSRAQNGHDAEPEHAQFGADPVPSAPPMEGGPAFAVMPDAWLLEPLDAVPHDNEPPVVAAEEAVHDPVPPQARHEAVRPTASASRASADPPPAADGAARRAAPRAARMPRAIASPQRRTVVLASALAGLVAVFAFIYWRAVSGPGPGARLPMVPMPAAGSVPANQGIAQQSAAIPVTPYVTPPIAEPSMPPAAVSEAGSESAAPAMAGPSAAPATRPAAEVTIPSPEQLAAIRDPAIRAEAMRDATERAARQVRAEGPPTSAAAPPATSTTEWRAAQRQEAPKPHRTASAPTSEAPVVKTAIGENGEVHFVRGGAATQVAPAVQHGYDALKSGDVATAHQQYDMALLQDPNSRDALLGAAAVALREHDGRQASSNYLRLLELDPNDPDALAGLAELRPGDLQANEIRLRGLARQHPESGPVQFALGNLFARQGRWPEAQQSYFRAVTAMPENADYAFNLGVGLDRMNQPRLAQTYYRRALELAQTSPPGFSVDAARKRLQALETPPQ